MEFGSATDQEFEKAVAEFISKGIFSHEVFVQNQNMFNFWIALETANKNDGSDGDCDHSAPQEPWVDAGVIVHSQLQSMFGNCADTDTALVSVTTVLNASIAHELGHVPFGLSDERDGGGKWISGTAPNVFDTKSECETDAPVVNNDPADCRLLTGSWWESIDFWDDEWWTSDPSVDVMAFGGVFQQPRSSSHSLRLQ